MNKDTITLIDENDNVLGKMDKYLAHKHPVKLHRAVSVWMINEKNQVLLQKRSKQKIVGAGWWANAICGNVRFTESYEECAVRRLSEEIGVVAKIKDLKKIYKFEYRAYCNKEYGEHELDRVYLLVANSSKEINFNLKEVEEVAWVDINDVQEQLQSAQRTFITSQQTLKLNELELKEKTKPFMIAINNKQELLAPWTWMMLLDGRFLE